MLRVGQLIRANLCTELVQVSVAKKIHAVNYTLFFCNKIPAL
jgi:hypothetical protein